MAKNPFFLLALICLITNGIRTIYEVLKHKRLIIPNKVSFVIMFINMLMLWASWVLLCIFDNHRIDPPLLMKIPGMVISSFGVIMFLTALFTIKTLESYEGDLITSGIYKLIRHPMYLGFIFWLIGFPLMFGSIVSFILSFIFICNILFWRSLEEKELIDRFSSYSDYKKRTIF